jgi:hypothetical protein
MKLWLCCMIDAEGSDGNKIKGTPRIVAEELGDYLRGAFCHSVEISILHGHRLTFDVAEITQPVPERPDVRLRRRLWLRHNNDADTRHVPGLLSHSRVRRDEPKQIP